jgi:flagellar biosynthesis GTPase FlhF
MLGLKVERFWPQSREPADLLLVDVPGVQMRDAEGLSALLAQLKELGEPHIHLVLNAAYETTLLFEQIHAFLPFQAEDLAFTHLDEEQRRIKLWNFVLGSTFQLRFLSAGKNVSGEIFRAEPSLLFPTKKAN